VGELNLAQITDAAIESLVKNNDRGFFLMVEGGNIDWSSHANDGTTTIHDMLDFNEAVRRACASYEKYPEETLIIVTADHETWGVAVCNGGSRLNTQLLANQQVAQSTLSKLLSDLRSAKKEVGWNEVKGLLTENTGLFADVVVGKEEEENLV